MAAKATLLKYLSIEHSGSTASVKLYTDTPAPKALRQTLSLAAFAERHVTRLTLDGTTRAKTFEIAVLPSGVLCLYSMAVYARVLPDGDWQWFPLNVFPTGDWQPVKLPIPETGDWQAVKLPIPETSDWQAVKLPIPGLGEWQGVKLPIRPSEILADWVDIPTDKPAVEND